MNVRLEITAATAEALTLFLAERAELWRIHAVGFGVANPLDLPERLAKGYQQAMQRTRHRQAPLGPVNL